MAGNLRRELKLLSRSAEEEFYEALSSVPVSGAQQDGEEGHWLRGSEEGSETHSLALHRAAFDGDVEQLRRLLPGISLRQKLQLDMQGNTALHVAVLRHQYEAVALLLEAGIPADVKNERRWSPLDEAIALKDAEATKLLYTRLLADAKRAKKEKKKQLVAIMEQLPDFRMQLRWDLGSPLFGLLLKHFAPDDTYFVTKVGNLLRVDGTLMGLDEKNRSFIPHWKRGSFSLLVNAGLTPTAALLVDHTTRTYFDLYLERKAHQKPVDQEVAEMLQEGAGKVRVGEAEFDFHPVKTWLGRQAFEKVEGWETEVYEASGSLAPLSCIKAAVILPQDASFQDYLSMSLPQDDIAEVPANPFSTNQEVSNRAATGNAFGGSSNSSVADEHGTHGGGGLKAAHKHKKQRFSSRCWLARQYPISLAQLIPLLEVVSAGNRHFAQAASYLQRFPGMHERFPVRVQLSFRHFSLLKPTDEALQPGFFELPSGYKLDHFEEGDLLETKGAPLLERLDSG